MSAAEKITPHIQFRLTVTQGPHAGQSFVMSKSSFTIGRGPENEIILVNDAKISRQHAKIQISGQDVEVVNLSQKNQVLVGSESIQKWKLLSDSTFKIGDSEIRVQFDLGQAVVQISPPLKAVSASSATDIHSEVTSVSSSPVAAPLAVRQTSVAKNQAQRPIAPHHSQPPVYPAGPHMGAIPQFPQSSPQAILRNAGGVGSQGLRPAARKNLWDNPKFKFYLIVALALGGFMYWLNAAPPKKAKREIKSTLRYEDEYLIKQNSVAEKELEQKRKIQQDQKNSPTALRARENFQKGMRDFNLGNYSRAMDFYQVVLNLEPNHTLARRQLYLAKVRFDEVLKSKLILGESYYQKHNFKMCEAMYQQVLVMLQGKSNDRSYQVAQSMVEKCRLASEGIR